MAKPVFPSSLYPLVYLFLQENGFERTALHFQDESKLGMVKVDQAKGDASLFQIYSMYIQNKPSVKLESNHDLSDDASASSSESESESENENESDSDSESLETPTESESDSDIQTPAKKKMRIEDKGIRVEHVKEKKKEELKRVITKSPNEFETPNKKRRIDQSTQFSRINPENVTYMHEDLKDNSFKRRVPGTPGERAHRELSRAKGRVFRKEKTKRKKGSNVGGGKIDTGVHSTKF